MCILALTACSATPYTPKPLDPYASIKNLDAQASESAGFNAFLLQNGYQETELPLKNWDLHSLSLSAIYHHPQLKLVEARRILASIAVSTAGLRQISTINGHLSRSNQANNDIRAWSYGLGFDIPIETSGKRRFRIEEAQHLANVARLDVAETAWQLRSQIAQNLLQYQEKIHLIRLLEDEHKLYQSIVNMLEKKLNQGLASQTELGAYRILLQKNQFFIRNTLAQSEEIQTKLAANSGLSLAQFKKLKLTSLDLKTALDQQTHLLEQAQSNDTLQQSALLNRIDIRRALAKYAAAEAKIQLEIAKQIPDFSISPGFFYEYGDKIWSLGIVSLLNLVNKNQTLASEATQLREIEAAQFDALQAQIIADLNQAQVQFKTTKTIVKEWENMQQSHQKQHILIKKQFNAGLIDKVELTLDRLNENLTTQELQQAQFAMLSAIQQIENIVQHPLNSSHIMPSEYVHE